MCATACHAIRKRERVGKAARREATQVPESEKKSDREIEKGRDIGATGVRTGRFAGVREPEAKGVELAHWRVSGRVVHPENLPWKLLRALGINEGIDL